jgi:Na+/H+ antiporter NhaA
LDEFNNFTFNLLGSSNSKPLEKYTTPYLIGGVFYVVFHANSGVHATVNGVLLAFAIPLVLVIKKIGFHYFAKFSIYRLRFFYSTHFRFSKYCNCNKF